jgi:ribonuclease HI
MTSEKGVPVTLEVYTDGACSNNGKRRPWAGIGVHWPHAPDRDVSRPVAGDKHSNNVAELQAIEAALDAMLDPVTVAQDGGVGTRYVLYSDSLYAIQAVTVWWHKWVTKGFPPGGAKNKDLIAAIVGKLGVLQAQHPHRVTLKHVYGHADCVGNQQADALARAGAVAASAAVPAAAAPAAKRVPAGKPRGVKRPRS